MFHRVFSESHGQSDVFVVALTAKIASSRGGFGVGSLDFDAPHLPVLHPLALNFTVVKQVLKSKEAEANEVVQRPFLNP